MINCVNNLEALLDKNDYELRAILNHNIEVRDEEVRRLICATKCLKMCQAAVLSGNKEQTDWFWDSWDSENYKQGAAVRPTSKINNKHFLHQPYLVAHQSQLCQDQNLFLNELPSPERLEKISQNLSVSPTSELAFNTLTPSPSPPNSPSILFNNKSKTKGCITTPPPRKKHQTLVLTPNPISSTVVPSTGSIINHSTFNNSTPDQNYLTKSKSHEFSHSKQQQNNLHVNNGCNQQILLSSNDPQPTGKSSSIITTTAIFSKQRTRLHTDPGTMKTFFSTRL